VKVFLKHTISAKDVDSQKKKEISYIVPEYHLAIGKDDMEDNTDPDHTDTKCR
jgi:hypothetical protein